MKGGTATLTAGEHELKLEITNDWIDIDYVEFVKVGGSEEDPTAIRLGVKSNQQVDMSKAQYFDMQGNRVSKSATKKQGVYLVSVPGEKNFIMRVEK